MTQMSAREIAYLQKTSDHAMVSAYVAGISHAKHRNTHGKQWEPRNMMD